MSITYCPRCTSASYEVLKTHCHCTNCNYSPTLDEPYEPAIPKWALRALKGNWEEKDAETIQSETTHGLPVDCPSVA